MAGKSILAVDDDASTLFYLEQVLGGESYTVLTANSGKAALTCLESEVPDPDPARCEYARDGGI